VSLIDSDRQWFKSKVGLEAEETSREISFCGHAILDDNLFVIEDATKDSRFADNPLVTDGLKIRFYAGAPLQTPDGLNIGTLCAIDDKPRTLDRRQRRLLLDLSHVIVDEMELRVALRESMTTAANEANERAMQNDFVSAVTHELRTPLTSILGSLKLIDAGAFGAVTDPLKQALDIASRNAATLLSLINDLLDFQKFGAGMMEFNFEPVSLEHLVRETCENMAGFAARREVAVDAMVAEDTVFLADSARLTQVISNILSNAVKFSPSGGRVGVLTGRTKTGVTIAITDRGPGIPEEFRVKVFEKFARAKGQATESGTGLGLAISKIIVEAHRGTIWFDTSAQGTTFHIELPLRQSLTESH
jgi:signal transduction histidine kinase